MDATAPATQPLLSQGALLAGLTRLVPVPFLDDVLLRAARARMMRGLFRAHGREPELAAAGPLYRDPWTCGGIVLWVLLFPLRVAFTLLKKLLKTLFFVLALREAALVIGHELMLGRAVDRALRAGALPPAGPGPHGPGSPLWQAAERQRAAFELAFAGSDRRVLWQLVLSLLRGARDLGGWGADAVRRLVRRRPAEGEAALPPEEAAGLQRLGSGLSELLRRPEVVAYVDDLDRRMDAALAERSSR